MSIKNSGLFSIEKNGSSRSLGSCRARNPWQKKSSASSKDSTWLPYYQIEKSSAFISNIKENPPGVQKILKKDSLLFFYGEAKNYAFFSQNESSSEFFISISHSSGSVVSPSSNPASFSLDSKSSSSKTWSSS